MRREPPEPALLRPIRPQDIPACIDVFHDSLDDLYRRLDQPLPPRDPGPMSRLLQHLLDHDGERAWLAEAPGATAEPDPSALRGFGAAVQRERFWFLSLLFVRPGAQGQGLGRRLLLRTFPTGPTVADDEAATLAASSDRVPGQLTDGIQP